MLSLLRKPSTLQIQKSVVYSVKKNYSTEKKDALGLLDFINASPSPFHCVKESAERLENAGFHKLKEKETWDLKRNGKYYFTRNGSALVAFAVGGGYQAGKGGFSVVGAHTDSPCLKVKPISKKENAGYLSIGVQLYGGGIWHTWFDRDLSVAGRVMVKRDDGSYHHTLVKVENINQRPILRVPTLAIHLDHSVNEAFKFNKEVHLSPILATSVKAALNDVMKQDVATLSQINQHHPALIHSLAKTMNIKPDQICDFELCLYDTQPSTLGGAYDEFIYSARLDNLGMSYCSLMGLIRSLDSESSLNDDPNIRMVALFDNEEVGSTTAHGADSNLLPSTLQRIVHSPMNGEIESKNPTISLEQAIHNSLFISADMAHAVHPNYSEKHEENHKPQMHKGTVIKVNANQRYATTAPTSLIIRDIAHQRAIPIQEVVVRNDSSCGSTVGPILSAKLGIRSIDLGNPQLSMHSIREVSGTDDVKNGTDLIKAFFELFPSVNSRINVD